MVTTVAGPVGPVGSRTPDPKGQARLTPTGGRPVSEAYGGL